jgi:hypothetical protein
MNPIIGIAAVKMVKLGVGLMNTHSIVQLGHGKLILIGQEDAAGGLQII